MALTVHIWRIQVPQQDPSQGDSPLLEEDFLFPRANDPSDIFAQLLPDGTLALVGPGRTIGLGKQVVRYELRPTNEDTPPTADGATLINLRLDRTECDLVETGLRTLETTPAIERLLRALTRKRQVFAHS